MYISYALVNFLLVKTVLCLKQFPTEWTFGALELLRCNEITHADKRRKWQKSFLCEFIHSYIIPF